MIRDAQVNPAAAADPAPDQAMLAVLQDVVRDEIAFLGREALLQHEIRKVLWCQVLKALPDAIRGALPGDVGALIAKKVDGLLHGKGLTVPRTRSGAGGGFGGGGDEAKGSGGGSGEPVIAGSCEGTEDPVGTDVNVTFTEVHIAENKVSGKFCSDTGQSATVTGEVKDATLTPPDRLTDATVVKGKETNSAGFTADIEGTFSGTVVDPSATPQKLTGTVNYKKTRKDTLGPTAP